MLAYNTGKEFGKKNRKFINVYASGKSYEYWQKQIDWINENDPNMEAMWVGCWNCEACRAQRMKEWAIRCMAEASMWENNYFLTLTYNDSNLVINEEITSPDTGCTYVDDGTWGATLVKEHLTKFNKDLRRYFEYHYDHKGIRFYNCGEYGGLYGRPHYHGIYFNLPLRADMLKPYKLTPEGWLYKCDVIEKIWGKGFITVAEVNLATCNYVAGYVLKKLRNDWGKEYYYQEGRIPEFNNMSRIPGIGREYYEQHKKEIYENDEIIINGCNMGQHSLKPPKYYDNIYDIEYPTDMAAIKRHRQVLARTNMELEDKASTLNRAERYELKRNNLNDRTKILKRRANVENDTRKCKLI